SPLRMDRSRRSLETENGDKSRDAWNPWGQPSSMARKLCKVTIVSRLSYVISEPTQRNHRAVERGLASACEPKSCVFAARAGVRQDGWDCNANTLALAGESFFHSISRLVQSHRRRAGAERG